MADVFISYARAADRPDRHIALEVSQKLHSEGLSVFMDQNLEAGEQWDKALDAELRSAKCVVAVWSDFALGREMIQKECSAAQRNNKLIPLAIEKLDLDNIPLIFENVQYVPFDDRSDIQWQSLSRSINRLLGKRDQSLIPTGHEQPIIQTSSAPIAYNVKSALDNLTAKRIIIPPYQRDSNQWDYAAKSLFIESIINNFAVPAFFFEQVVRDGRTIEEVVDGQQRLLALQDFREGRFKLVDEESAEYIMPHARNYADRYFTELSERFKEAFDSYPLTIIRLIGLGDNRLQVFRRINLGGTPLSPHDIRMAYYWAGSAAIQFIRLTGASTKDPNSQRIIDDAKSNFNLSSPWADQRAADVWHRYWHENTRASAAGQKASEMFLWSLVSFCHDRLDTALRNRDLADRVSFRFSGQIEQVLDAFCAIVQYEDGKNVEPKGRTLPDLEEMKRFFELFQVLIGELLEGVGREKSKLLAIVVGALAARGVRNLGREQVDLIKRFVASPRAKAKELNLSWPEPRGSWSGRAGYREQMIAAGKLVEQIR